MGVTHSCTYNLLSFSSLLNHIMSRILLLIGSWVCCISRLSLRLPTDVYILSQLLCRVKIDVYLEPCLKNSKNSKKKKKSGYDSELCVLFSISWSRHVSHSVLDQISWIWCISMQLLFLASQWWKHIYGNIYAQEMYRLSTDPKTHRFIIDAFALILLLQLGHGHAGHSDAAKIVWRDEWHQKWGSRSHSKQ